MFGRRIQLFRLFGFQINLDPSWFVVAVLFSWYLATSIFPQSRPGFESGVYWAMGIAGVLGLFASVVLHELGHALAARRVGVRMRGITLFIFGGVAEMTDEPPRPAAEFWIAVAGPAVSLVLAVAATATLVLGSLAGPESLGGTAAVAAGAALGVLQYLAVINGMLLLFNLVPAFPLDGGRVLRSLLWSVKGDLRWATRVTSALGSAFGLLLILAGVVSVLMGDVLGGLWWFLIGIFLKSAAQSSYRQLLVREHLQGEAVERFMERDPVTVERSMPVAQMVQDYLYRHHFKMFPVVDDGRLLGCVTLERIKELPKEEWSRQSVGTLVEPCTESNTIAPHEDATQALARMSAAGASRLMVVATGDDGERRLVGMVTLRDLLAFLSAKLELGG